MRQKRIFRGICSCAIKVRKCFEMRFNRLDGLVGSFGALLVGDCGTWAVSRMTPIYFIVKDGHVVIMWR